MLSIAAIGMAGYGTYSIVEGVLDLFGGLSMGLLGDAGLVLVGLLLVVSAALVRLMVPGGFALALSGLLALQALALRNSAETTGVIQLPPQILRACIAAFLLLLAYVGARNERARPRNH